MELFVIDTSAAPRCVGRFMRSWTAGRGFFYFAGQLQNAKPGGRYTRL